MENQKAIQILLKFALEAFQDKSAPIWRYEIGLEILKLVLPYHWTDQEEIEY